MPADLRQYVYISTVAAGLTEADVGRIVTAAQRNNARHGITGFLIFNGRNFLQLVEGEEAQLLSLMSRIVMDRRHNGLVTLEDISIPARAFPDWSMHRMRLVERTNQRREAIEALLPDSLAAGVRRTISNFASFN